MTRSEARAARARDLAREHPEAAEILSFYADLTGMQQALLSRTQPSALGIDCDVIASLVPEFLEWLRRAAPDHLAEAAADLRRQADTDWPRMIRAYWNAPGHDVNGGRTAARGPKSEAHESGATEVAPSIRPDELHLFVIEAVLQPFAEAFAATCQTASAIGAGCPVCSGRPVVATLREQGHGARRGFVCGLCATEFSGTRLRCPHCDESRFDALPVYRVDTIRGVRVDACDTCKTYIKTIDLTENGHAIPVVDDLATLAVDLWAKEQGYTRLRANLLRL